MDSKSKLTMNEQVYQSLRNDILTGRYKDGEQLLQKDLAEMYHVSRIPVREALVQLASDGLVTIVPYKGAVVASFSMDELHEIFEIRFALESLILRSVVENITAKDAQYIHERLLAAVQTPPEQRDRNTNWEFHSNLYCIGNKPRLLELIEAEYNKIDRYIQIDITLPNVQENAFKSHDAILQACLLGDPVEATVLLHEHMMTALRRMDSYWKKKMNAPATDEMFILFPPLVNRPKDGPLSRKK